MKMKKITSVLLTSAMTFHMLLSMTGCGGTPEPSGRISSTGTDEASGSGSAGGNEESVPGNNSDESSAESISGESDPEGSPAAAPEPETTAPESSDEASATEPENQNPVQANVEPGTVLEYKMAFYFDESVASNETDVIRKVVQNISNGYETITDESLLNDQDTYQLFWAAETGATLTIPIEIPADGKYDIGLCLHKGGDFGTHQIFIGETLITTEDIDLYSQEGGLADYTLGAFDLTAGETELLVRCAGQNEASAGSVFGINSVTLTCEEVH